MKKKIKKIKMDSLIPSFEQVYGFNLESKINEIIDELESLKDKPEVSDQCSVGHNACDMTCIKRYCQPKTEGRECEDVYEVPYAWYRNASSLDKKPQEDTETTKCVWCHKTQSEILMEHIDWEDSKANGVSSSDLNIKPTLQNTGSPKQDTWEERFRRKYEGANWESVSSMSINSMIEDIRTELENNPRVIIKDIGKERLARELQRERQEIAEKIKKMKKCEKGGNCKLETHSTDSGSETYCTKCFRNGVYIYTIDKILKRLSKI